MSFKTVHNIINILYPCPNAGNLNHFNIIIMLVIRNRTIHSGRRSSINKKLIYTIYKLLYRTHKPMIEFNHYIIIVTRIFCKVQIEIWSTISPSYASIFYRYILFFHFFVTVSSCFEFCHTRTYFRRTDRFGAAAMCRYMTAFIVLNWISTGDS